MEGAMIKRVGSCLAALLLTMAPLTAQWLNYPTLGIPRTADGKPDLSAPTPKGDKFIPSNRIHPWCEWLGLIVGVAARMYGNQRLLNEILRLHWPPSYPVQLSLEIAA